MMKGFIAPVALACCLAAAPARADLVLYTFTANVTLDASPLKGASVEFLTLFDYDVAPTLVETLPGQKRYTFEAIANQLRITGSTSDDGTYEADESLVIFTAVDEFAPSTDVDSLTYEGSFTLPSGLFDLDINCLFMDHSIFASLDSEVPVFDTSDPFIVIADHSFDGAPEINFANELLSAQIVPDGTAIPEASTLLLGGMGVVTVLLGGLIRRNRSTRD